MRSSAGQRARPVFAANMSRWENAPSLREVIRLMRVVVALYCGSYDRPPSSVTLDIDDALDVVHGHQQLSMYNAHYDERCFLPIHIYDTAALPDASPRPAGYVRL